MPSTKFNAAVANCSITQADDFAREGWKSWASGRLSDRDVGVLQTAVDARKRLIRASIASQSEHPPATTRRRPARSQDRRKSITRRRRTAMSGVIPGALASNLTMGEIAVLSVVGREIRRQKHHRCELTIDAIAALAGVCRSLAQRALHESDRLGIINTEERHRPSQS